MAKCDGFARACGEYQVGDKVFLYMPGIDESNRYDATIVEIDPQKGLRLEFAEREGMNLLYFHPRQCRKPRNKMLLTAP